MVILLCEWVLLSFVMIVWFIGLIGSVLWRVVVSVGWFVVLWWVSVVVIGCLLGVVWRCGVLSCSLILMRWVSAKRFVWSFLCVLGLGVMFCWDRRFVVIVESLFSE